MRSPAFDPALLALAAEAFCSRLAFGIVAFALPLYARQLGLSLFEISLLVSANLAVAMVLKLQIGALADRLGTKQGALIAIACRSAFGLLLVFAGSAWQLFGIQAMRGVAKSLRDSSIEALLAEHGGKRAVGRAFAWYKTATSAAGTAGKGLAGVLITLTASNYSAVFLVAFVFSLLPLLVVWRWVKAPRQSPQQPDKTPVQVDPEPAAVPAPEALRFWPVMGFGFLVSGTAQMLRSLFPLLAVEYAGLTPAQAGLVLVAGTVVTLLVGPVAGWLTDRERRNVVLLLRSLANIVSSAIYLLFPGFAGFLAAKSLDDAGKAAFNPAWGSMMAEMADRDSGRRALRMGRLGAAEDAGAIAGPVLAGLLWSSGGVAALFGVRIALAVVTEAYAWLLLHRRPRRDPSS